MVATVSAPQSRVEVSLVLRTGEKLDHSRILIDSSTIAKDVATQAVRRFAKRFSSDNPSQRLGAITVKDVVAGKNDCSIWGSDSVMLLMDIDSETAKVILNCDTLAVSPKDTLQFIPPAAAATTTTTTAAAAELQPRTTALPLAKQQESMEGDEMPPALATQCSELMAREEVMLKKDSSAPASVGSIISNALRTSSSFSLTERVVNTNMEVQRKPKSGKTVTMKEHPMDENNNRTAAAKERNVDRRKEEQVTADISESREIKKRRIEQPIVVRDDGAKPKTKPAGQRFATDYAVGEHVEVKADNGSFYPAVVSCIEIAGCLYKVQYRNEQDENVITKKMRKTANPFPQPMTPPSPPKAAKVEEEKQPATVNVGNRTEVAAVEEGNKTSSPLPFFVGEKIQAKFDSHWYSAEILEILEGGSRYYCRWCTGGEESVVNAKNVKKVKSKKVLTKVETTPTMEAVSKLGFGAQGQAFFSPSYESNPGARRKKSDAIDVDLEEVEEEHKGPGLRNGAESEKYYDQSYVADPDEARRATLKAKRLKKAAEEEERKKQHSLKKSTSHTKGLEHSIKGGKSATVIRTAAGKAAELAKTNPSTVPPSNQTAAVTLHPSNGVNRALFQEGDEVSPVVGERTVEDEASPSHTKLANGTKSTQYFPKNFCSDPGKMTAEEARRYAAHKDDDDTPRTRSNAKSHLNNNCLSPNQSQVCLILAKRGLDCWMKNTPDEEE